MSAILQARGVTFAYGDRPVLREVSLTLAPGELVALIGPNGSGKSTLLRALLGHLLATGSVAWDDRALADWRRRDLARRVAYLPQSPTHDVEHRVIDVLRLGRAPYWSAFGIESARDGEVVEQVARRLALVELLSRRMDELSGGQRQRVFLGRCLVQQPGAMLLDEPNTYLDVRHQVEMTTILRELARDDGVAILMASHDLNLAAATADRLVLLKSGTVAASGSVDDVLEPELLSEVYGVRMRRITGSTTPVVIPVVA